MDGAIIKQNCSSEKEKEVEKSVDSEKEKGEDVVDVETYETTKPAERSTGGITKRLRSCSGKAVPTASKNPAPRVKTKGVGPVKGWSKVFSPTSKKKETLKRKKESSSDSDYDVAKISSPTPKTKTTAKKASQTVEEAPSDNISFHRAAFALRWDYIYQRRLAVERELTKDALKCQDILDYIKEAGLLKTVCDSSPCYELLVKEFLVNIPEECDNPLSKDYPKVYVRGKCINFSPVVINNYLGSSVEPKAELEVANDIVSSEITVDIKVVTDTPKKRESAFTFHHKLFGDHNVADHVGTSADGAGTMTKKEIIAALKMIEGLEADDAPVKASANVVAAGEQHNADEDEAYDTTTDAEDDDSESSDDE
ncbi:uncharacterized protein LOC123886497 [Trifolium pratense]|uniref:uncharacterized protein LOC123886497 n=1 Tax=Trifolium pratense TaxID=57577 RepID=UPI001E692A46|nr:uncharacterized protein LOC123886497 [Trifolium pratense]